MQQQIALGVGALLQFFELVLPVEGDAGRDDIALFRGLDRRLQQGIEPELAVIAQDGGPGIDRAGNGDSVRRSQRNRMHVAFEVPFRRRGLRRAARAVIGDDLALALRLNQREAIAADTGGLRLDHAEQRTCRHRGIGRGATGAHHLDGRQRGKRMRRRHHPILGVDRRPAGEMEIPHAKLLTSAAVFRIIPPVSARAYMAHSDGSGQWRGEMGAMFLNAVPALAGTVLYLLIAFPPT